MIGGRVRALLALPLVGALIACGGGGAPPPGCRPDDMAERVTAFLDTFDRGEPAPLAAFFPERDFKWYVVSDVGPDGRARRFEGRDRAATLAYLAERQRQHERLRLRQLRADPDGGADSVGFAFTLERQADDLPSGIAGHLATGKGSVACATGTITVWSMGQSLAGAPAGTGPGAAADMPGSAELQGAR
jgi:hypothetical protein